MAPLRLLLALLFAGLVVLQVAGLPAQFGLMAQESPELAYLRWPLLAFSVVELLCVQAVIVCTWRLLTMVEHDQIFSEAALVWVDAILWAIAAAWVLLLAAFGYFALSWGLPGLPVLLLLLLVAGAVLELLMVVMRALLRQATTLRTDMEAVI